MTEDEFWDLIGVLKGSVDAGAVLRLTAALQQEDPSVIIGFADRLAAVLRALDIPGLAHEPFWDADDPERTILSGSADAFLYARCAVVVAGQDTYLDVLRDERRFARAWDLGAEALLEIAPQAYEQVTGRSWDHEGLAGAESAANAVEWASPEPDQEHERRPAALADSWLVEVETGVSDAYDPRGEFFNHPERVESVVTQDVSARLTSVLRDTSGLPSGVARIQISLLIDEEWDLRIRPDGGDVAAGSGPRANNGLHRIIDRSPRRRRRYQGACPA